MQQCIRQPSACTESQPWIEKTAFSLPLVESVDGKPGGTEGQRYSYQNASMYQRTHVVQTMLPKGHLYIVIISYCA